VPAGRGEVALGGARTLVPHVEVGRARVGTGWPATIYIIRHGEKPGPDGRPPGLDAHGHASNDSLTVRGWQRAAGLAVLFGGDPIGGSPVGPPQLLIAPRYTNRAGSTEHRSYQTLQPLRHLLDLRARAGGDKGVGIATECRVEEHEQLVHQIRHADVDTVLIAWEHHNIAPIAELLTGGPIDPWPDDRFDLIWRFTSDAPGSYRFDQLPQLLLVGDAAP